MIDKVAAERLLQSATGGQAPSVGDTLVWTERGWALGGIRLLGALDGDPSDPKDGDLWVVGGVLKIRVAGTTFNLA